MRVAYVTADPGVPVFGRKGCSVHVQEVVRAFRRAGVGVDLFATRFGGEAPADLRTVRRLALPAAPAGESAAPERAALAGNRILAAALRANGPFDLVYERYSLWSYAGMEFARDAGVPGLLEVNAPLIDEQAAHRGLADRAGAEECARRAFGAAAALVAVSRAVAAYLSGFAETRGRVHVVPNGVDSGRFPPEFAPSLPGPAGSFSVGFVGTLKPWHGLPVLVEAFDRLAREVPDARLLIVGDGPGRGELELNLAHRHLTSRAVLTGAVDPEQVPGLLASMDAAVAPYPEAAGHYFSPLKLYEYLAAGRAVVASRVGQVTEVIEDEVNGLLVPPGDAAALAAALERLAADAPLRARLGLAARDSVLARHTWDAVARRLLRLALARAEVGV